jgi:hypothetical protein
LPLLPNLPADRKLAGIPQRSSEVKTTGSRPENQREADNTMNIKGNIDGIRLPGK